MLKKIIPGDSTLGGWSVDFISVNVLFVPVSSSMVLVRVERWMRG